jgi:hypothetical protein
MSGKQETSRHKSKGGWQAGRRSAQRSQNRQLLLIWLAVLIVAMAAPVSAFATPSTEDPTGGSSLAGITSNPSQDDTGARASPDGDGLFSAWFTDPGEWFDASSEPLARTPGWSEAAGSYSAWFTDPGEWFTSSPEPLASTLGWNEAAGSYSALRLAAAGTGDAVTAGWNEAAGSYTTLRLAAKGAVAQVAGASHLNTAAGSYGVLRSAAGQGGADKASTWPAESAWLIALSEVCAEPSDDPVFGASSPAEAEFYDSQCSIKGAAFLIGSGGSHRQ